MDDTPTPPASVLPSAYPSPEAPAPSPSPAPGLSRTKAILEVVGMASVVASLIFVGLQMRQSAEATRAATVLDLKQSWVDLNLATASNPHLTQLWASPFDSLSASDQHLVMAHFRAMIHIWSNAYYQYRTGTLEPEQWEPLVRDIDRTTQANVFWKTWDDWGFIFDEPFTDLIEQRRP